MIVSIRSRVQFAECEQSLLRTLSKHGFEQNEKVDVQIHRFIHRSMQEFTVSSLYLHLDVCSILPTLTSAPYGRLFLQAMLPRLALCVPVSKLLTLMSPRSMMLPYMVHSPCASAASGASSRGVLERARCVCGTCQPVSLRRQRQDQLPKCQHSGMPCVVCYVEKRLSAGKLHLTHD